MAEYNPSESPIREPRGRGFYGDLSLPDTLTLKTAFITVGIF